MPVQGSYDIKCLCKHSYRDHNVKTKKCLKCKKCKCFTSRWSCSCTLKYDQHKTIIETRKEKDANEGSFGDLNNMITTDNKPNNMLEMNNKKKPIKNHLGMKLKSKIPKKKKSGNVELAVNKINRNGNLASRYQGPQNITDLADYGDKFEAQIDRYNEKVAITGGPPKNISKLTPNQINFKIPN